MNTKVYYYIPSGIPKEMCDIIKKNCYDTTEIDDSVITKDNIINHQIRSSKNSWLATDSWVAGMMSHFIHCANDDCFNFNLTQWTDRIQYTIYKGKGSHYDWHYDTLNSTHDPNLVRKLSITMMLSDKEDYEGGQFQLMISPKNMCTFDMKLGDVVIFPSDLMHRVRPLKSGERTTLVGWFGGPPFK